MKHSQVNNVTVLVSFPNLGHREITLQTLFCLLKKMLNNVQSYTKNGSFFPRLSTERHFSVRLFVVGCVFRLNKMAEKLRVL